MPASRSSSSTHVWMRRPRPRPACRRRRSSDPANWERDQGFNVFQNMLQAHADIDPVFAASDLRALGAIEAIAAAGKTGKIRVVGFDALDDAKKAIAAGTMEASVAQFPAEMGRV